MNYEQLDSAHDHTLLRPDTYLGSVRTETYTEYIADEEKTEDRGNEKNLLYISKKSISYTPAILRLFIESLSNAIDNVFRSRQFDVVCKQIKVSVDKETGEISVWNDGLSIPIRKHERTQKWIPDMLFGNLFSSSNYNDEEQRETSGRNGMGISLTNIFSTRFRIELVDPPSQKKYIQEWTGNMKHRGEPKITRSSKSRGYTQVSWIPDFTYFKVPVGYTDDFVRLIRRYVVDAAMNVSAYKVSVFFNDTKIPIQSFKDYVKMYTRNEPETIYIKSHDSECVITSSSEMETVSFVNGIHTKQGGVHVDVWSDTFFKMLVQKLNTKYKDLKLSSKDIKHHFRFFVRCSVPNPEFATQDKEKLVGPRVNITLEPKYIQSVMKWKFIEHVERTIEFKNMTVLKKTERKRGMKRIEGFDPANKAGGKESKKCTLILCEGLSAKTYAVMGIQKGIEFQEGNRLKGRDWYGIMPLRGKLLNVRKSNATSISNNKEISNIIQALGIQYGTDYSVQKNFDTLRYGKVMILTDQDVDGYHIMGLVLNMFDCLFPTLIRREGFVMCMHTPIVQISLKNETLRFYNLHEARSYIDRNRHTKMGIKYYKGLGTSNDKEVKETFGERVIMYTMDEDSFTTLDKVFNKSDSDYRKTWMTTYNFETSNIVSVNDKMFKMNVSEFVNKDFIQFSIDDCKRSIPSVMDGMKESNRKILYASFLKHLTKPIKVAQLAGFVAEKTNYHHGEGCLFDTITSMAQDFVGSNNISVLSKDGQFGTRLNGGKDAANARYIYTQLSPITRAIFKSEDDPILEYIQDDGETIEPTFYTPVIPMILVNGSSGIGTGWSSSIPSYNPLDIIKWIRSWMKGDEEQPTLIPWFRGFKGTIKPIDEHRYETCGIVEDDGKHKYTISELPIGKWTDAYKEYLEDLLEQRKIKSMKNYSTPDQVHFVVTGLPDVSIDWKLSSMINTNNLVLFNHKGVITRYDTIHGILEEFCGVREQFYTKRKTHQLSRLEYTHRVQKNKYDFLGRVMDDTLVIHKRSESDIRNDLEQLGFWKHPEKEYEYLLSLPMKCFSKEKLHELKTDLKRIENEIRVLSGMTERDLWEEDLRELEQKLFKQYT